MVDHPTQLICIWILICQHTKKKTKQGKYTVEVASTGNDFVRSRETFYYKLEHPRLKSTFVVAVVTITFSLLDKLKTLKHALEQAR